MRRIPVIGLMVALAGLFLCASAHAQTSYTFKDSTGATQTVTSFNCGATICGAFVPIDPSANALATTTGSAVPTSALYMGVNVGGNLVGWDKSVTQSAGPWTQNLTQWAGSTLATPTAYGQPPGIGSTVPTVNAFVTNLPALTASPAAAFGRSPSAAAPTFGRAGSPW